MEVNYLNSGYFINHHMMFPLGNFFEHEGEYEVGFDYTFFCAIHPNDRPKWGRKWAELIKSGGTLLLFVFPNKTFRPEGPPWPVTSKDATSVLQECNFIFISFVL